MLSKANDIKLCSRLLFMQSMYAFRLTLYYIEYATKQRLDSCLINIQINLWMIYEI